MNSFQSLDLPAHSFILRNARIPGSLVDVHAAHDWATVADGDLVVDLLIDETRIREIQPAGRLQDIAPIVDLRGRQLWPGFVDVHTHLDKGHAFDRLVGADGSFGGAVAATMEDRTRWSAEDLYRRMTFALRCAEAHGVMAIRTHLDSYEGLAEKSWGVFRRVRDEWAGRITLQAVALMPLDVFHTDHAVRVADIVAASGGILGGGTRAAAGVHGANMPDLDALLDKLFSLAKERDLDIDLHVDETSDREARALRNIAQATLRHDYVGRVTCGHCCSLALQEPEEIEVTIDLVRQAGISVVTLPTVNMYLQDREAGRTPRWRGVTPVQELRAAGVRIAVAGDNCRDGFHAYGDNDVLDTFRQGIRILHLDHPFADAPAMVTKAPAEIMRLAEAGVVRVGVPASFVVFNARSLNELISRPQADRIVVRSGVRLACSVPDYEELG